MRLVLTLTVLVIFSVYTLGVMVSQGGPFGFLALAQREPWGMQLFLDLGVMLALSGVWMWHDAKEQNINVWPHLALLTLGSPGPLLYLVHRELKRRSLQSLAASRSGKPS